MRFKFAVSHQREYFCSVDYRVAIQPVGTREIQLSLTGIGRVTFALALSCLHCGFKAERLLEDSLQVFGLVVIAEQPPHRIPLQAALGGRREACGIVQLLTIHEFDALTPGLKVPIHVAITTQTGASDERKCGSSALLDATLNDALPGVADKNHFFARSVIERLLRCCYDRVRS